MTYRYEIDVRNISPGEQMSKKIAAIKQNMENTKMVKKHTEHSTDTKFVYTLHWTEWYPDKKKTETTESFSKPPDSNEEWKAAIKEKSLFRMNMTLNHCTEVFDSLEDAVAHRTKIYLKNDVHGDYITKSIQTSCELTEAEKTYMLQKSSETVLQKMKMVEDKLFDAAETTESSK